MSERSTNAPRASSGLVARERLELRGAAAPADEALLAILVGANSTHTAGALLEARGTAKLGHGYGFWSESMISSESRMLETRKSGCVSSEGWPVQRETVPPGQQSGTP